MQPRNSADLSVPRASVRSSGDAGFIFFNNYVRGDSMPVRAAAQFQIRLPGTRTLEPVPRRPIDLPSGSYFIWPFNLRMSGITLRYSTAQIFARLQDSGATTLYFEACRDSARVRLRRGRRALYESIQRRDRDRIRRRSTSRHPTRPRLVDRPRFRTGHAASHRRAHRAAKPKTPGRCASAQAIICSSPIRILSPIPITACAHLSAFTRHAAFPFAITPPPAAPLQANAPLIPPPRNETCTAAFTAEVPHVACRIAIDRNPARAEAPPIKSGPAHGLASAGVAQAPAAGELPQAAQWSITVPAGALNGLSELFLEVKYEGDVARLTANRKLLDDDFYNGKPWMVGLERFLAPNGSGKFRSQHPSPAQRRAGVLRVP